MTVEFLYAANKDSFITNISVANTSLGDSTYHIFEDFGTPKEIFLYDAWANGENIPPVIHHYVYKNIEITETDQNPGILSGIRIVEPNIPVKIVFSSGDFVNVITDRKIISEDFHKLISNSNKSYEANGSLFISFMCNIDKCIKTYYLTIKIVDDIIKEIETEYGNE